MGAMRPLITFDWPSDAVTIGIIIVVALLARWIVQVAIRRIVALSTQRTLQHLERLGRPGQVIAQAAGLESRRQTARAATMGSVLGSAATLVISVTAILMILGDLGINLAPLLASAGVGGVALAFGAQSLVKDVLSGLFLIVEDQFGVGDVITSGEVTGTVEHVGLRVTSVRDASGMLWYLRNGEITTLGNVSQGWSIATVDIPVHPGENASRAIEVLDKVAARFSEDEDFVDVLVDPAEVLGVEAVTAQAMTLRLTAKCLANQQWGVQRELREQAKQALDEAGIRGPIAAWAAPRPT